MIELHPEYPVEQIGEKQLYAIQEDNRIMSHLKQLCANWNLEEHDLEDLAELCWRSGFQYASSRFFHLASEEEQTQFHANGGKLPKPQGLI